MRKVVAAAAVPALAVTPPARAADERAPRFSARVTNPWFPYAGTAPITWGSSHAQRLQRPTGRLRSLVAVPTVAVAAPVAPVTSHAERQIPAPGRGG